MVENLVLKDNICYSQDAQTLKIAEQGYAVCMDGRSAGVYRELPEMCVALPLTDYEDRLIVPGLVDLHLHALQYSFRGLGMDLELLEWLNIRTFPEEAGYKDNEYARKAYSIFVGNMKHGATTGVCIFATLHRDATEIFMDLMEETGSKIMVGRVNMDRNSPDLLVEGGPKTSTEETTRQLEDIEGRYKSIMPTLIPRSIPTCSGELMEHLKEIQVRYDLPMQSHPPENRGGIPWVQELCPWSELHGNAYDHFGLFGNGVRTIMAHCARPSHEGMGRIWDNDVLVAHCPQPNTSLSSGTTSARTYLGQGVRVGLGTGVTGGAGESIFRAMTDAVQVSRLRWRLVDESLESLITEGAFYLGTVGGGTFFGKVGSFEEGHEFDAVALNDQGLKHPQPLGVRERLECLIYFSDERHIDTEYASGNNIFWARSSTIPFR